MVTATEAAAARRGAAVKTATAATAMKPTAASTVEAASTATAVGTTTASATVATAAVLSECRTWRGNERNPKKCSEEEFKKCRPCHVFALHQQTGRTDKGACEIPVYAPSYQIGLTRSAVGCNPVNRFPINSRPSLGMSPNHITQDIR